MPRALSREEQQVLTLVRRRGGTIPVPMLADELGFQVDAVQTICTYLAARGLLDVSIYAVAARERRGKAAPETVTRLVGSTS